MSLRSPPDDVTHCRINPQTLGVVGVLLSGQTTEDSLTQQGGHGVKNVMSGAGIVEKIIRHLC